MRTETEQTTVERGSDEVFGALAHDRRRRVLAVLRAAEEPLSLTEVAIELTRRHGGPDGPGREDPADVRVALHHRHLPKLADAGLVEYDAAEKTVALAASAPAAAVAGVELEAE